MPLLLAKVLLPELASLPSAHASYRATKLTLQLFLHPQLCLGAVGSAHGVPLLLSLWQEGGSSGELFSCTGVDPLPVCPSVRPSSLHVCITVCFSLGFCWIFFPLVFVF